MAALAARKRLVEGGYQGARDVTDDATRWSRGCATWLPASRMRLQVLAGRAAGEAAHLGRAEHPRLPCANRRAALGRPPAGRFLRYPVGAGAFGSFCQSPNSLPCGSRQVANHPMLGTGMGDRKSVV